MPEGTAVMAFYTSRTADSLLDDTFTTCERAGFELDDDSERKEEALGNEYQKIEAYYDRWWFNLGFNLDESRPPSEPVLSIGCGQKIYPVNADDEAEYREKMDAIFELFCQLSATLDVDYAPLFNPMDRAAVPEGRPISDTVEELPRMGVYSQAVIDQFGGLDAMFESEPWYTASLGEDKTAVVETETPWTDGGWQPPTDADYLDDAMFADPAERSQDDRRGLSDPFAALDIGEIGTDLCVPREKIGPEFRNEDLELVRVRVDENRDLRRVDTGAFVRNVVDDDPGDDIAFMMEMLADIPADATDDDLMVSTLLHESIPPSFVRLDEPEGRNVVTKVMTLDVETNKHDLLVSLGRVAQLEEFDENEDLELMCNALDKIADLEDVDGIEKPLEDWLI